MRCGLDRCHEHLPAVLDKGPPEVILDEFDSAATECVHGRVMHAEHSVLELLRLLKVRDGQAVIAQLVARYRPAV